jgi:ABC-type nitrate/sulfonate/bicarbonate transport system substrate-binding protein
MAVHIRRREFILAMIAGASTSAHSQDMLKVAVPQRGSWDAGLPELGKRGGIFKKHGLGLEILYTQAGPESIQALIAASVDIATASGVQAAFGTFGKGAPIRIISSEIIGSPDLYWYVPFGRVNSDAAEPPRLSWCASMPPARTRSSGCIRIQPRSRFSANLPTCRRG